MKALISIDAQIVKQWAVKFFPHFVSPYNEMAVWQMLEAHNTEN